MHIAFFRKIVVLCHIKSISALFTIGRKSVLPSGCSPSLIVCRPGVENTSMAFPQAAWFSTSASDGRLQSDLQTWCSAIHLRPSSAGKPHSLRSISMLHSLTLCFYEKPDKAKELCFPSWKKSFTFDLTITSYHWL